MTSRSPSQSRPVSPSKSRSVSPTKGPSRAASASPTKGRSRSGVEPLERPVPDRLKKRNPKGGVVIYEEELRDAFEVLDTEGRGLLTREDLTKFLNNFFPGMYTKREIYGLVGSSGMKFEKLRKLVIDNDIPISDLDPVAEAFSVLDPQSTGRIDDDVLRNLVQTVPGVGELSQEDFDFLLRFMDKDGDGLVTLEDFARVGSYGEDAYREPVVDPKLKQTVHRARSVKPKK
eukprot:120801-Prorocentrum_minimum.AAC.1